MTHVPPPSQSISFNFGASIAVLEAEELAQGMGRASVQMRRVGTETIRPEEESGVRTNATQYDGVRYEAYIAVDVGNYNAALDEMLFSGNRLGDWTIPVTLTQQDSLPVDVDPSTAAADFHPSVSAVGIEPSMSAIDFHPSIAVADIQARGSVVQSSAEVDSEGSADTGRSSSGASLSRFDRIM